MIEKLSRFREGDENIRKEVQFDYNTMGHRIAKHVINPQTQIPEKSTYYILDAQGNPMNIYEHLHDQNAGSSSFTLNPQTY